MKEREELKELVVVFLKSSNSPPTASQLFDKLRNNNYQVVKKEGAYNLRSFVKIINGFSVVESEGKRGQPMVYKLKQ